MTPVAEIAGKLTERAKRALRMATKREGHFYASPFDRVPARLIECQVWGFGDQLNEEGLSVREYLLQGEK